MKNAQTTGFGIAAGAGGLLMLYKAAHLKKARFMHAHMHCSHIMKVKSLDDTK